MSKFIQMPFCQKLFGQHLFFFHVNVQCVYIVEAICKSALSKAKVSVDFPILSNPYQNMQKNV